uniref:Zinc finger protein 131 n=1 Tax=Astyanax mexicanus TaxID=7994 RepID=A0A3B1IXJ2_ASTMX
FQHRFTLECFPAHYKVMLDKLNEQRQLDQFTDITLIVDGHQFRAHKAVLAACTLLHAPCGLSCSILPLCAL